MVLLLFCTVFFQLINVIYNVNNDGFQQFHINRAINPLISYQDVTLFRYTIDSEILIADWKLLPNISSLNCDTREIVFVIRWQGYPLIKLNQFNEPYKIRSDILLDTDEQYQVLMKTSDLKTTTFTLHNPLPGIWLAFAYFKPAKNHRRIKADINLFDENKCKVNLSTHLSFKSLEDYQKPIMLFSGVQPLHNLIGKQQFYKFYAPMDTNSAKIILNCSQLIANDADEAANADTNTRQTITLNFNSSKTFNQVNTCLVDIFFRRQALPSSSKYDQHFNCNLGKPGDNSKEVNYCIFDGLNVTRNHWNYLLIVPKNGRKKRESDQTLSNDVEFNSINVTISLNITKCTSLPFESTTLASTTTTTSTTPISSSLEFMNMNSIDDFDSQQDPTIFSSFTKREAGTTDLRNNIWFGRKSKTSDDKMPSKNTNNNNNNHHHHHHHNHFENAQQEQCPLIVNLVRYNYQGPFSFKYDYINPIEDVTDILKNNHDNYNNSNNQIKESQYFDIYSDMIKGLNAIIDTNNADNDKNYTRISVLSFQIIPLMDSGGSLTINLTIKQASTYSMINSNNVSVEACINYDHYLHETESCLHKLSVNSSHLHDNSVRIPYPRAGYWFVTFKSDCYHLVGSDSLQYIPSGCKQNTTAIQFSIKSFTCSDQDCGKHGKCHVSLQDGLSFSTCSCSSGWKGIDCGDDSTALDEKEILLQFLSLTISNIVFIPVLILALYRKLYTESFLYLIVMTSSILHHACDSDSEQSFCLINSDLLDYIDHYSLLLAFWVTLITLSNLPTKAQTFLHLVGSFFLAIAVQTNPNSLLTLLIPIILGFLIVTITWCLLCVMRKTCFPSYQLWLLSMIPGLILTTTGLVSHSLFESKEYYPIVHSFWHIVMASALLFLIPYMGKEEQEVKSEEEENYRLKAISPHNSRLAHVEWKPHTSFKFLQDDIDVL